MIQISKVSDVFDKKAVSEKAVALRINKYLLSLGIQANIKVK